MRTLLTVLLASAVLSPVLEAEAGVPPTFHDDFSSGMELWHAPRQEKTWAVHDNGLYCAGDGSDTMLRARIPDIKDAILETEFRLGDQGRRCVGIAVRAQGDQEDTYLLLRYYDRPAALEVLSFKDGAWKQSGRRSSKIEVLANRWYRCKVAVVGDRLFSKLWPTGEEEPEWQLNVPVDNRLAGQVALVVHDDTTAEFRSFRAWTGNEQLAALQTDIEQQRLARRRQLNEKLECVVVPDSHPIMRDGNAWRDIHLVAYADNDRHPVSGHLTFKYSGETSTVEIDIDDFQLGGYTFSVPEPTEPRHLLVEFASEAGKDWQWDLTLQPPKQLPWRTYVRRCLDTLIEHGRDDYGEIKSPLMMSVLDVDTLRSPSKPLPLDSLVRLEGRIHRRGERGSNLWYDQKLLKSMARMSELNGDQKYATAADDYVRYFFDHCFKKQDPDHTYLNGMPSWGTHIYWDCYTDQPAGDGNGNGPHEILVFRPDWEQMFRVHPDGVRKTIDGIWEYHLVDKTSGLHNRHDDRKKGCDFAFSGGSFVHAFAFMQSVTKDPKYLHQANTVAGWHWNNRNKATSLTADCPGLARRYDGNHCFTTVVGPHALSLLEGYRLCGEVRLRDAAIAYIKAFDKYGWDEEHQTYWAMLKLDGTPVPEQPKGSGYDAYAPYGPVNVWRTTVYSYEFTLAAAQAAMEAYETTVRDGDPDSELLQIALRWAGVIEEDLPPHTGRRWKRELEESMPLAKEIPGVYAEDYGRAISLFVHLYRATHQTRYLTLAEQLAGEAVRKLYHNGLFRGHPAKPYYETTNGVGLLLFALLELDAPEEHLGSGV